MGGSGIFTCCAEHPAQSCLAIGAAEVSADCPERVCGHTGWPGSSSASAVYPQTGAMGERRPTCLLRVGPLILMVRFLAYVGR